LLYPLGVVSYSVFVAGEISLPAMVRTIFASDLPSVLRDTAFIVGASTIVAAMIGSLLAWLVERTDIGMRNLTRFLPQVPLFVQPIADAIGWVLLASPRSWFINRRLQDMAGLVGIEVTGPPVNVYSVTGLVFVFVIYFAPNVFITVSSHLRNLDPALEEAARMSGAGVLRTLVHITIPSVWPAAVAGMLLCLIMGLSLFSLPAIVGGPARIEVLSVRIVHLIISSYPPQTGIALLLALFVAVVIGLTS
jgi:iron(III) transport system permease protein